MKKSNIDPFGILEAGEPTSTHSNNKVRRSVDVRSAVSQGKETFFGSKRRAIATGVGILGLWSFLGYNKEVVPSPTETVNAVIDLGQKLIGIPDAIWGEDDSSSSKQDTTLASTSSIASESTLNATDSTTVGTLTNLVPVLTTPSQSISSSTSVIVETTQQTAHTPTAVFSGHAGSDWKVECFGPTVPVVISPNAGPAIRQLAQQTGEPWDVGAKGSPQDAELYAQVSGGKSSFEAPTLCEGLTNW